MKRRYAATIGRSASLSTEFGLEYATHLFGEEAVASLPVLQRGPNKGKPKGYVIWLKTTEAGYHPNAGTGVAAGTVVRAWIGEGPYSPEQSALRGTWLGRTQELCGSRSVLGPQYREREAARQAAQHEESAGD